VILKKASLEDCDDLFAWRNDKETRRQSFNDKIISYDEHCKWFEGILKSSEIVLYVGIDEDGKKCGAIRFDFRGSNVAEVNLNVAPHRRGKGIGTKLISKGCDLIFLERKPKVIMARVKEENIASLKSFKKAGFFELFRCNDVNLGSIVVLTFVFKNS
jgi:RimJ/RimL family protein N-acetyltransferase